MFTFEYSFPCIGRPIFIVIINTHHHHMHRIYSLLFILLLSLSCTSQQKKSKILFITTNVDVLNGAPNGTYLIEFAVPFAKFSEAGYSVDLISPKGGKIPIYHSGDTTDVIKKVIKSELFVHKTNNTLVPSEINAKNYAAVIIPGGYGQFWDTHQNKDIQELISSIYENGGTIGSLGHGTATLINVKLRSGAYLVKDKTMTSFPSWNEKNIMKQSNYGQLLPYDMEVELQKRGANLKIYNHEKKTNYEVVDMENRLVTAAFASGGNFVAEQVIKSINQQD
ncbi:type 1 glutamine amidotransferase domain-containing protein [Croceivirga sp. JEA036]|uniref:type 1 glutamine amidotransferase domain-containing protein n=1 Tax=Croceivirga sp. JEA036 TaxID=2721162 RepID=UPI00143A1D6B|nr:type 1 glutamine amidotransferase domain-containing protein [Croceivirga sp. JEA036]NJB37581.1 type 1 glutamine amidotransferase domain-containing protein [Croceivirga sp. JEA036]